MSTYLNIEDDMNTRGGFGQQPAAPPKKVNRGPRRPRTVLVLHVVFKYQMDLAKHDVVRIHRALGHIKRSAVLHGDRQCGWVLETSHSAAELRDLVRDALSVDCVENAWVFTPGADVVGILPFDPFSEKVTAAWSSVRDWNRTTGKLPPQTFAAMRPMADGRGEVAVRILDRHPLSPERAAARRLLGYRDDAA